MIGRCCKGSFAPRHLSGEVARLSPFAAAGQWRFSLNCSGRIKVAADMFQASVGPCQCCRGDH
eukprot:7396088-Lingulodinium_polyedra.AAC.1